MARAGGWRGALRVHWDPRLGQGDSKGEGAADCYGPGIAKPPPGRRSREMLARTPFTKPLDSSVE
jgi:hypothetical protein